MQRTAPFSARLLPASSQRALRLTRVVNLTSGDIAALIAETDRSFGEGVRFGPTAMTAPSESALDHVTSLIEEAGALARALDNGIRPIHISLPMAAVMHPALSQACEAAAARTNLCPQELCINLPDAALLHKARDGFGVLRALRTAGFRVGLDATRSWDAPLTDAIRLLLENVTIRLADHDRSPALQDAVAAADRSGMVVTAHGAKWRDADWLANAGITHAIRPRSDS